jgi:hypothetical protein
LYGAFVWTRRALNGPKRRFPARRLDHPLGPRLARRATGGAAGGGAGRAAGAARARPGGARGGQRHGLLAAARHAGDARGELGMLSF